MDFGTESHPASASGTAAFFSGAPFAAAAGTAPAAASGFFAAGPAQPLAEAAAAAPPLPAGLTFSMGVADAKPLKPHRSHRTPLKSSNAANMATASQGPAVPLDANGLFGKASPGRPASAPAAPFQAAFSAAAGGTTAFFGGAPAVPGFRPQTAGDASQNEAPTAVPVFTLGINPNAPGALHDHYILCRHVMVDICCKLLQAVSDL